MPYAPADAPYSYCWGRYNPVGIVASAIGAVAYLLLLDPLTLEAHGPFNYVSASIPAFLSAAVARVVLAKAITIPRRKGHCVRQLG